MIAASCVNCGEPYPVRLPECPECLTTQLLTPVPTRAWNRRVAETGYGSLTVVRTSLDAVLEMTVFRPQPSTCDCTDCGRNQPLINCPHCRGEGTVQET